MQVSFNRSVQEKKGFFGGKTKYRLEAMLDLTPDERAAMSKTGGYLQFLANGGSLDMAENMRWANEPDRKEQDYFILDLAHTAQLLNGLTIDCSYPEGIPVAEEGIVKGAQEWKRLSGLQASFSGDARVLDI